jgi:hypothetical protein
MASYTLSVMKTCLDLNYELQLEGYSYDGNNLVAEVSDLYVGPRHHVIRGKKRYRVTFSKPIAHAVTEEFPAVVAELVNGSDEGFLRRIESGQLTAALGLDLDQFENQKPYAMITAHEILVAYCLEEPTVEEHNGAYSSAMGMRNIATKAVFYKDKKKCKLP